jgi:hypothetical protein
VNGLAIPHKNGVQEGVIGCALWAVRFSRVRGGQVVPPRLPSAQPCTNDMQAGLRPLSRGTVASVASRYCGAYGPRSNGAAQAQRISSGLGATTAVHEPAVSG